MKLRHAKEDEKQLIQTHWTRIFAHDDGGHSPFYFDQLYQTVQSYVLVDDSDALVASAQVHPKILDLNGTRFTASFIVGVFTLEAHRQHGHMHTLLTQLLDVLSHQDVFSLIQGYNPDSYVKYGFEKVYPRRVLRFSATQLPNFSSLQGGKEGCDPEAALALYRQFCAHFTLYHHRSLNDMRLIFAETQAIGGRILSAYDARGLIAYALVYPEGDALVVDELVYLNAKGLLQVLSPLRSPRHTLVIKTSPAEDLLKLFPKAESTLEAYTSLRLNQARLLSEHLKLPLNTVSDLLKLLKKPLWIRENQ